MKRIIIIMTLAVMATGCIKEDAVKIREVEDISVSVGSTVAINAFVWVENSSARKIKISDALFHISDAQGRQIGTVTIAGEVVLNRKSLEIVEIPARLRFSNPFVALSLAKDIKSLAPQLLVTGSAKLKIGGIGKKYEVENVPLSKFISIFGINSKVIEGLNVI